MSQKAQYIAIQTPQGQKQVKAGTWTASYNESSGEMDIHIDEYIGWWETDRQIFKSRIEQNNPSKINLYLTSLGGYIQDAKAIYNYLVAKKGIEVTAYIQGDIASATTVIAMAANTVNMCDNCLFLIHEVSGWNGGTADQLRKEADAVEKMNYVLAKIYEQETNMTYTAIRALMKEDRWMDAQEALSKGFVDSLYAPESPDEEEDSSQTNQSASSAAKYTNYGLPIPKFSKNTQTNKPVMSEEKTIVQKENQPTETATATPEPKTKVKKGFFTALKDWFVEVENEDQGQGNPTNTEEAPLNEQPSEQRAESPDYTALQSENAALRERIQRLENSPATNLVNPTASQQQPIIPERIHIMQPNWKAVYRKVKGTNDTKARLQKTHKAYCNEVEAYYAREYMGIELPKNGYTGAHTPLERINLDAIHTEMGSQVREVSREIITDRFRINKPMNIQVGTGYIKDREYTNIYARFGKVMQPGNCEFNPKSDVTFTPYTNIVRSWKGDDKICPQDFFQSYFNFLAQGQYNPWEHPFVPWLIREFIETLNTENDNEVIWFGEYNPSGTDGVDSYNGFHTLIDNGITAANTINTGAFNPATDSALEYVESFIKGFPLRWKMRAVDINIPIHIAEQYVTEYYTTYNIGGHAMPQMSPYQSLPVAHYMNYNLIPTLGMGTGNRLVASLRGVMQYLTDGRVNGADNAVIERDGRQLKIMVDAVGSSAIGTFGENYIRVNDQAAAAHPEAELAQ